MASPQAPTCSTIVHLLQPIALLPHGLMLLLVSPKWIPRLIA
jgi:hypothetical protein